MSLKRSQKLQVCFVEFAFTLVNHATSKNVELQFDIPTPALWKHRMG